MHEGCKQRPPSHLAFLPPIPPFRSGCSPCPILSPHLSSQRLPSKTRSGRWRSRLRAGCRRRVSPHTRCWGLQEAGLLSNFPFPARQLCSGREGTPPLAPTVMPCPAPHPAGLTKLAEVVRGDSPRQHDGAGEGGCADRAVEQLEAPIVLDQPWPRLPQQLQRGAAQQPHR